MHAQKLFARESGGPVSVLRKIGVRTVWQTLRGKGHDERIQGV